MPSTTITMKIDFTTDAVVCVPSDSALPRTAMPSVQAISAMISAMNGALMRPLQKRGEIDRVAQPLAGRRPA